MKRILILAAILMTLCMPLGGCGGSSSAGGTGSLSGSAK